MKPRFQRVLTRWKPGFIASGRRPAPVLGPAVGGEVVDIAPFPPLEADDGEGVVDGDDQPAAGGQPSATLLRVPPHDGETDQFGLQRFVTAQDSGGTYERAAAELRAGRKASHWMWFVFPQIAGLGYSPTARTYAITSLAEARAYLAHPVLGPRLAECAAILAGLSGRTAEQVFGEVDALKLRSSMTLFMHADPGQPVFRQVLERYFDGIPDPATEQRL